MFRAFFRQSILVTKKQFFLNSLIFGFLWSMTQITFAAPESTANLSSYSLEFGQVTLGSYKDIRVDVTSIPTSATQISAGDINNIYFISSTNCDPSSSSSCYAYVRFSPNSATSYNHTIRLDYIGHGSSDYIQLSGEGVTTSTASTSTGPLSPYDQGLENNSATGDAIITTCTSGNASAELQRDCNLLVQAANDNDSQTSSALNQITPETATKSSQVTHQGATTQARNITSRMVELRSGSTGLSVQGFSLNLEGKSLPAGKIAQSNLQALGMGASADETFANSKWGVFISGDIAKGERDASSLESDLEYKTYGLTAGVDYRINDKMFLGAALGILDSNAEMSNSNADLDTRGYSLSMYGSYYLPDNYFTDFSITYGKNSFDQNRNLNYQLGSTTVNQTFNADYSGKYYSILLGAGKDIQRGAWSFGPRAKFEYTQSKTNTATETASNTSGSGSGWVTQIDENKQKSMTLQLGGRVSYAHSANWGALFPYAQLDYVHEFKQNSQLINAHFVQDPASTQIQIQTDSPDRNFLKLNLGSSAQFKGGVSGFANYSTVLSNSIWDSHTLSVGVRVEF